MSRPQLVLKQSTGWFAAGWQFGQALGELSDAAFKLYAWLCLNADRHTGQLPSTVPELSSALKKPESWTEAALRELVERGVCWMKPILCAILHGLCFRGQIPSPSRSAEP